MATLAQRGAWRPLLADGLAEKAREAVRAIASDLGETAGQHGGEPSVAGGAAGVALLHGYLHTIEPGSGHDARALAWLDGAIGAVSDVVLPPHLYAGFPGIAWTVEHLRGRVFEPEEDDDPNEEIDDAVRECLDVSPWRWDYDLIVGLVGLGVYIFERLPRPAAARSLSLLLDRLEETAERRPEGITWLTPPELLWGDLRTSAPNGLYNLGVAHGVPGVIGLLAAILGAGFEVERVRPLLAGAVDWLLSHQASGAGGFLFPGAVGPGFSATRARLAWCYGDAGIAATLLLAGRLAGEPAWERAALEIARHAARCPLEQSGVNDAGLCHGSAGLGHLFNRLYQASGDEELAAAARFWFGHALDLRHPGTGFGGYLAWEPPTPDAEFEWLSNPGFLSGSAGIGLALLAATSEVEPLWDRLLLTAIPPRPVPEVGV